MVNNCKICKQELNTYYASGFFHEFEIQYFECSNCKFVQTNEPIWLEQAYSSAINRSDTGLVSRNLNCANDVFALLAASESLDCSVLDYAGGYGLLVRRLRDMGIDAVWFDPYCTNLMSRGFEYSGQKVKLLTAFEVFEHFQFPMQEMKTLLGYCDTILFSTELIPVNLPMPEDWWYYGLEHGQHIAFYREETFHYIANQFGLNYLRLGASTHLFHPKKASSLLKYRWKLEKALIKVGIRKRESKLWEDHLKVCNEDII